MCLWDILEYVIVINNSLYSRQYYLLILVYKVLFRNISLAIRIRKLAGEKGRKEGLNKYICKANNISKAVIRDSIKRLGYYYAILLIYT